ncbi:MAG TPA: HD domain-containing protein [Candidatus Nitrosocosmicus sp.]|nr:HD domain-containing protein [Candidatus Nitrosocosmicus sp.]
MKKESINFKNLSPFLSHFYTLKNIERSGWKNKLPIDKGESVAEHTLAMIVLTVIFAEYNNYSLSKTIKMIKMALIHDLGESIIGDYTPESIELDEKKQLENMAMSHIFSKISRQKIKKKYLKIWNEYEDNKTFSAKKIHSIDKLEMAIQAKYYLDSNNKINKNDVKPFFDSALSYIRNNNKLHPDRHLSDFEKWEELDEIEQIFLYINK